MISIVGQLREEYIKSLNTHNETIQIKKELQDSENDDENGQESFEIYESVTIKEEDAWKENLHSADENDNKTESNNIEESVKSSKRTKQVKVKSNPLTSCEICGLKPKNKELHQKRHLNDYTCNICQKRVNKQNKISHKRFHELQQRNAAATVCQLCEKTFKRTRSCAIHEANFHGILNREWARKNYSGWPHRCDKCEYHFRCKELIWYHKCKGSEKPSYDCKICHEVFDQNDQLTEHTSEKHKIVEDNQLKLKYRCEKCDKSFTAKRVFEKHLKDCIKPASRPRKLTNSTQKVIVTEFDKSGKEGVQCAICGKKFRNKGKLKRHIECVHLQEKPFVCEKCPQKYAEKRALENHFAAEHVGTPRYECEFCGKKFFAYTGYLRHRKIQHTDELAELVRTSGGSAPINELYSMDGCTVLKDISCDICSKTFPSQEKLNYHRKVDHALEKTFNCTDCDDVFSEKRRVEDHYSKKHLKKARYECEFCQQQFYYHTEYCYHRKHLHSEGYAQLMVKYGVAHVPANELYSLNFCTLVS